MGVSVYLPSRQVRQQMNIGMQVPSVFVGETLTLEIKAQDPIGIKQITIECYHFSQWNPTRCKTAVGEYVAPEGQLGRADSYRIRIPIPVDAAIGKWGIRSIRFVNGRNNASTFYRGQERFDDIVFEVLPLPTEQDVALRFEGVAVVPRSDK